MCRRGKIKQKDKRTYHTENTQYKINNKNVKKNHKINKKKLIKK